MNKRAMLIILAALFFGPVIAAYVWYFHGGGIQTETVNRGDLVEPPVSLSEAHVWHDAADNGQFPFTGKWSIVHVVRGECDATCTKNLYTSRQVWRRLNKDMDRVQRFLLLPEGNPVPPVLDQHPALQVLRGDGQAIAAFGEAAGAGRIYLVDPLGFLMMSYPQPLEPEPLYKDLQRLLKYSKADAVQ